MPLSWFVPTGTSSEYIRSCLWNLWFLLTKISYKIKKVYKINKNKPKYAMDHGTQCSVKTNEYSTKNSLIWSEY